MTSCPAVLGGHLLCQPGLLEMKEPPVGRVSGEETLQGPGVRKEPSELVEGSRGWDA